MPDYTVTWEIQLTADTPRKAAEQALAIQRDQNSTAQVFRVEFEREKAPLAPSFDIEIDLTNQGRTSNDAS